MGNEKKEPRKRIEIVSVKLCREGSVLYSPRKISSPVDAVELCRKFLEESDREQMIVISLDTKNQPTSINVASVGTLNSALCHPREIYKAALLSNADSIIVSHNHPSGTTDPSREDISITKRLVESGEILGVSLIDHIIIGSEGRYTSLKEKGVIKE